MHNPKFMGGILLIAGTSIGGGMLALPIATAALGFTNSIVFLFLCWLITTASALLLLEVNLCLPAGNNIISMAKATLGIIGQIVAWISYLCLLYALLSGYIAGGSDVLNSLLSKIVILPSWTTSLIFTFVFSLIVYMGISAVDYMNRGFMICKFAVYLLLVTIISPKISLVSLQGGSLPAITSCLMILVTSFGFSVIISSLREYYQGNLIILRKVVLLGSLVPLVCYILWNAVIMGVLQNHGNGGLQVLMHSNRANSDLVTALSLAVQNQWISAFFSFFASICMVTAFLGVSTALFDFFADGLNLKKTGRQGKYAFALTFLPPLLLVIIKPGVYIAALSYAGICCVILLLLLPALMAWRARQTKLNNTSLNLVPGGNLSLSLIIVTSLLLLFMTATGSYAASSG